MSTLTWIIHILHIMSLTVARSERVRGVLTHASRTKITVDFSGARVSNTLRTFDRFTQKVNKGRTKA